MVGAGLKPALSLCNANPTPYYYLSFQSFRSTSVFVHRSELWGTIKRSIAVQRDEGLDTTLAAAVIVRDRTRENGRAAQQRTVSRTLLVKGLEYDHAMILNAGSLGDAQDFYVAATRGRRTLNVLSEKRVLQFSQPDL